MLTADEMTLLQRLARKFLADILPHPSESKPQLDALLSEKQVEKEFHIKSSRLQNLRYAGGGPPFKKFGRSVRYRRQDVADWIDQMPAHHSTSQ